MQKEIHGQDLLTIRPRVRPQKRIDCNLKRRKSAYILITSNSNYYCSNSKRLSLCDVTYC